MKPIRTAVAEVDGGSRGNPGPAGCGFVLRLGEGACEEHAIFLGETTNNVAEYAGLLAALRRAHELGVESLTVRSDSELLIRQLAGSYRVRAAHLVPLWQRARKLMARFRRVELLSVRREVNREADRLANRAMDTRQSTLPPPEELPCR